MLPACTLQKHDLTCQFFILISAVSCRPMTVSTRKVIFFIGCFGRGLQIIRNLPSTIYNIYQYQFTVFNLKYSRIVGYNELLTLSVEEVGEATSAIVVTALSPSTHWQKGHSKHVLHFIWFSLASGAIWDCRHWGQKYTSACKYISSIGQLMASRTLSMKSIIGL